MNWLTDYKIPVGPTAKSVVDWLTTHLGLFFDTLAAVMQGLIDGLLYLLQLPHPLLLIAIFAIIAWLIQRRISVVLLTVLGFLFIINQGYWEPTLKTLTLVLSSCFVCMAIGVPLGIAAAHRPALYAAMRPVLDLMQTLPTFVYLIPAIVFFGIGMVPGLLATVIFVIPAPIRLTQLGISSTPSSLIEAGEAWRVTLATSLEGRTALCDAANPRGPDPDDHAFAFDGGHRRACRRRRPRRAGGARAELRQHFSRLRSRFYHRRGCNHT